MHTVQGKITNTKFQMMSSWSVVLVSAERFVAVWIPTKAKSINTKRNMLICEAVLFIFFSVYDGCWTSFADIIINGYDKNELLLLFRSESIADP